MNISKRFLSMFLVLCMFIGLMPMTALAADNNYGVEETAAGEDFYRILHLDCGRKYFTKDWIIALINEMAAAGYNQLQLAFGNDGLRFLLDDMSFTANNTTYSHDTVVTKVEAGNKAQNSSNDSSWLTQTEMDAIVVHANEKGIEIVPLLNLPGHANAILDIADDNYNASGSDNTLNVAGSTEAQEFGLNIFKKYVDYFAGKGCKFFSFGADEYANDAGEPFSFSRLNDTEYAEFVDFISEMAAYIENKGMTARAFNDGLYYNDKSAAIDTDIQCCYWSSGWYGYTLASASAVAGKGHPMINTLGDYYYILGKDDKWTTGETTIHDSSLYTSAAGWDNTQFSKYTGSGWTTETISDPAGAMFCIWCDYPNFETETQVAANTRLILRAMAAEMAGNDASSIDTAVVSGGFNADGTINVSSSGATTGAISGAPASMMVGDTVTLSVGASAEWTSSNEKVITLTSVSRAVTSESVTATANAAGTATITAVTDSAEYTADITVTADGEVNTVQIDLTVDGTKTVTIEGVDLSGQTFTPAPDGIANVTVEGKEAVTGTTVSTTKATTLEAGATYIIRVYNTSYALTSNQGGTTWGDSDGTTRAFESYSGAETDNMWTLEATDGGYKLKNDAGYLNLGKNAAWITETGGDTFTLTYSSIGWTISDGTYNIDALGGLTSYYCAGGWANSGTRFDLYKVTEATEASTEVTFTGVSAGTTYVTINETVYKIIVHGNVDITIKYQTADGTVVKTETVSVADNATTYTVSNFNYNDKYYVVGSNTLDLDDLADGAKYTVTVTEVEEDLSQVSDLTVEYFITNQRVSINNVTQETISATEVYSENGAAFADLVPASNGADNPKVFWKGWLLPDGYHQEGDETGTGPADRCTDANGTLIERIRYWNGEWAYYNGTEWTAIKSTDQIVAYYLQQTAITDEVTTNVTDWGETYADWKNNSNSGHWFWQNYVENGSKYVFMDFAVVYEDGTQTPAAFPTDDTWFFHFDGCSETNPRVLKPISFDETGDYEIWKVTVTDGTSDGYSSASTFTSTYDDTTETIVWSEDMGSTPHIDSISYTENMSGKLVRIYVRAVETEDTLSVVYYDEKFGDTLYTYNISVASGVNFTANIVGYTEFASNTSRIDVSAAYIVNALNKSQYFETDLTQVPEAKGKYNSELYTYTGSKISEDGKTLYLYYNINESALSPNFVVDFGLPITFPLSDVVTKVDAVDSVGAISARYGTLTYKDETSDNVHNGTFTYTPTQILPNIDVLSITLTITGTTTTTNVGITPATTVYYNESFIKDFTGEWEVTGTSEMKPQATVILGESDNNNFGYDSAYDNQTGASNGTSISTKTIGDNCTFTFTGTGIQVFANCTDKTGRVAVTVKNSAGKIVSMSFVDTVVNSGDTNATTGQTGDMYGLPIVSLIDLTNMLHDQYTVTITKILDKDEPVSIDGIRVFGTIEDSSIFANDLEDNPSFYEMRDMVLNAIGAKLEDDLDTKVDESKFYQIYDAVAGAAALITDEFVPYANSENLQDLLDNGPKNELFLYPGQTLTFKVKTARVMQIGLKAPAEATEATIEVTGQTNKTESISSSVDMFYTLVDAPAGSETEYTVSITNSGSSILSVTLLKICDDPNAAFVPLDAEDIAGILGVEVDEDIEDKEPEEDVKEEEPEEDEKVEIDFENDEWFWDMLNLVNSKFAIIAEAYEGGSISKEGVTYVKYYNRITYTITPDEGYEVESVIVDGEDVGAVRRYTFRQVKDDHTISVKFKAIDEAAE